MRKVILVLVVGLFCLLFVQKSFAYDPHSLPNNKFGVHILFPSEIIDAAKIINSSGGDWGYVTIPIQSGDKDLVKWQQFMNDAKRLHVIPIIRLATNGDYFNTKVWEKPTDTNVLDFANFLNSLTWPTQNRYVVIYNEVNRGNEWGGKPDATEYASILSYAVSTFKTKNKDFFILSAGLDNAAANTESSLNEYYFMQQMDVAVPGIFNQIDGLASHSYPNPGFSEPPSDNGSESVATFKSEYQLAESLSIKKLPVFITETGWSTANLSDSTIASYFKTAFESVWSDENVIAVTPFLLKAGSPPFDQFSLIDVNGNESLRCEAISDYPKIKGSPVLTKVETVLGTETLKPTIILKSFQESKEVSPEFKRKVAISIYNWLLKL